MQRSEHLQWRRSPSLMDRSLLLGTRVHGVDELGKRIAEECGCEKWSPRLLHMFRRFHAARQVIRKQEPRPLRGERLPASGQGHPPGPDSGRPPAPQRAPGHSPLKRWLLGTYHGRAELKHLQAYLDEVAFRFNRRKTPHAGKIFFRLAEHSAQTRVALFRQLVARERR